MKKILGCLLFALVLSQISEAQTSRYIIKFKDKGTNPYSISNPSAYLSARSIARRTRYSIPIDSTDLPITPRYIDSVQLSGAVTIINKSKWLNSVSIQTTDANALAKINTFPFVQSVTGIAPRMMNPNTPEKFERGGEGLLQQRQMDITSDFFNYGNSFNQVHIHNGEFLHNIGLRGQSMVIGIMDAGFQNYLTVKAFDSIRNNGQILGVYDFVIKDSSVNEDDSHGMECFSTIGANVPGQFVGTAPKANFYLFRTENASSEYPIEEHNWVCGAERVDSVGGDVISSSLGYNTFDPPLNSFDHVYATDFNGNTTMPAIGADLAAKKGILVVNSAGNEGTNGWHFIITPADGDSVLAVGAVNTAGAVANFSSFGPSSDGQVKPDVASVGVNTVVQFPNNSIGTNNGTSFSAPNMAGLTTCLWQGFPEYNNMKIINALRQSGSIASAPDNRIGYGIPDVRKAFMNLLKEFATGNATVPTALCKNTVNWQSKDNAGMRYEIERKNPGQSSFVNVGQITTSTTGFGNRNYQFPDTLIEVSAGTITYRIRQVVDTSASGFFADYIDTFTVNSTVACVSTGIPPVPGNDNAVVLSPNPTRNQVTVKIITAAAIPKLVIRIFNNKGQELERIEKTKGPGPASFDVSLARFVSGKYYISVYNDNKLITTKELIKL